MSKQKTCPCGQEFQSNHGNAKYCPACREARYNARHPLKTCRQCGQQVRDMGRNHTTCSDCRRGDLQREIERRRQQRLAQYGQETSYEEEPRSERIKRLIHAIGQASPEVQQACFEALIDQIIFAVTHMRVPVEEVSPEEVPHADQDRIDAAFRRLMDGEL